MPLILWNVYIFIDDHYFNFMQPSMLVYLLIFIDKKMKYIQHYNLQIHVKKNKFEIQCFNQQITFIEIDTFICYLYSQRRSAWLFPRPY